MWDVLIDFDFKVDLKCHEKDYHIQYNIRRCLFFISTFQLAIQHGFGGQYSREKGAWMVESVCNWFQDNGNFLKN